MIHGIKKAAVPSALVFGLLLAAAIKAESQQFPKVPRIGILETTTSASISGRIEALRQGLRDLGYIEGQSITIEYRYADGKSERIPDLAAELVNLKVDLIVTSQTPTVLAIKKVSSTIPIVFFFLSFPVENGIVNSFARPGGSATGLTTLSEELNGKRLELLKDASPTIARVGVFSNPANPTQPLEWKGIQAAAVALGLKLQSLDVRSGADLDVAFEAALKQRAQALINLPEAIFTMNVKRITGFATKNKLPAMCTNPQSVDDGCLMSYGPNQADLYRRGATYVDKILKGAKPADLPVEQPTKFDFVINLKTAKQIGLTIPQKVLIRADKVIK